MNAIVMAGFMFEEESYVRALAIYREDYTYIFIHLLLMIIQM